LVVAQSVGAYPAPLVNGFVR